jgi:hypothetical protein
MILSRKSIVWPYILGPCVLGTCSRYPKHSAFCIALHCSKAYCPTPAHLHCASSSYLFTLSASWHSERLHHCSLILFQLLRLLRRLGTHCHCLAHRFGFVFLQQDKLYILMACFAGMLESFPYPLRRRIKPKPKYNSFSNSE